MEKKKSNRKTCFIRILLGVFALCMVFAGGQASAQAASKKWTRACKAYKKYLAKNESKFVVREGDFRTQNRESKKKTAAFMILDMDKNGIPELITWHNYAYKTRALYVYTYKKGKIRPVRVPAVPVGTTQGKYEIFASNYTGGGFSVYGCSKKHLHLYLGNGAGSYSVAYTMKNGKLKCYMEREFNFLMDYDRYKINGKSVKASKYYAKSHKCKCVKEFKENNRANRKKIK